MGATGAEDGSRKEAGSGIQPFSLNRRRLLQGAAVGAGAIWAAPAILSVDAAHAATVCCGQLAVTGQVQFDTLAAGDNLNAFGLGGTKNSDTTMFLFLESSDVTGFAPFTTDSGDTITDTGVGICSWLLHHSPITGTNPQTKVATISFGANEILGYDFRNTAPNTTLDNRDAQFGFPGVTYPTGVPQRRTDDAGEAATDVLTPSGVSPFTTLSVTSVTTPGFVDQVRIYTSAAC